MPGVLLLGSPDSSWRDWLRQFRAGRDLIVADPSDASLGAAGRICLWREDKLVAWRFFGSLSPLRSPHVLLGGVLELLPKVIGEPIIQLFPYRPGPLLRQLALLIAEVVRPEKILIAKESEIDLADWPTGPEEAELEKAMPAMVESAQRRAQWLRMLQQCSLHEVSLRNLTIEGARLGSGRVVHSQELKGMDLPSVLHGEVCGTTLLLISDSPIEEESMGRAFDATGASKAQVVSPSRYEDLLCSFARTGGEDFGFGVIRKADFSREIFEVACTAVAPTPVQVLRIGGLRISEDGSELGEIRPWEV